MLVRCCRAVRPVTIPGSVVLSASRWVTYGGPDRNKTGEKNKSSCKARKNMLADAC